jgi:hypothetical protein
LIRVLWDAFPEVNVVELALEAARSWNISVLRWLLEHKIVSLSPGDVKRLFDGACASGSCSCASLVFGFSGTASSYLRGGRRTGEISRVICDGSESLETLPARPRMEELFCDSLAKGFSAQLGEWLPEMVAARLVASWEGRDLPGVNYFIDAAKGLAKTLTFVETENGASISGGYLDVAWVENGDAFDPGRRSFVFTLKNHLGMPPTKFAHRGSKDPAACAVRDGCFYFGDGEGFDARPGEVALNDCSTYERPGPGAALFYGPGDNLFRAGRWELWEVM